MSADDGPVSRAAKALSIALALLAPARMAWIVFTNGENNLSNDYVARVPLVGSMLDGTCSFGTFVRNAWIGGSHSTLAVTPIYALNARFFAWSVWVELGLGLALAAATLVLLVLAIPHPARWPLLPLLSLLLFSTSRVTVFTFGEPALQYGLSQLGLMIGTFAFARRPERPVVLALAMAFGGVLASWSWGGGIMAWPVFFLALALRRERRVAAWAVLSGGAAAGLAQYAWLLPREISGVATGRTSWVTKGRIFLDVLGRPFANGIAHADPNAFSQAAGAAGLVALAAVLFLLRTRLRTHSAPLILVSWALFVAAQIAFVRAAVAPWYASPMAFFWAGLLMLLAAAPPLVRAGGILGVALLTLAVEGTWEDKSFYLPSRAPISASCLREWRTAPPECHARVFQWGEEGHSGELALLGEPLERRGLSVFGPRRTYLLQGDAPLGRVRIEPGGAPPFLSADGRTRGDPNDFRRLDLVLAPGAAAAWRIDLPPNQRSACFESCVRASTDDPMLARGARVAVMGDAGETRVLVPAGGRELLSLDLRAYAGKTVTLRLTAEEVEGGAPLVFEAPKIELRLAPPSRDATQSRP
ncbi:MAG: hypothetical protein WCC53_12770 [Thermoanaerobaculia bacterium]